MNRVLQAVAVTGLAGWAPAQELMYYSCDLNNTGSDTISIGPGESVTLELWATWEPDEYIFAQSLYDILGVENWDTGTVSNRVNQIDDLATGPGDLQPNNDIMGIEAFVLPPFFGSPVYHSPALLYTLTWTPDDPERRTVRVTEAVTGGNSVYTDYFGTTVVYGVAPSDGATIHIIPAPASLLTIGLGGLILAPRRYRRMA